MRVQPHQTAPAMTDSSVSSRFYTVERLTPGEPLIDARSFIEAGLSAKEGRNINGPSVIRIPDWMAPADRAHPDAKFYMYFGHHGGSYIRLAWASELTGPWKFARMDPTTPEGDRGVLGFEDTANRITRLGPGEHLHIYNHMASPRVFVDHANQRFALFFHAPSGINRRDGTIDRIQQRTLVALSHDGLDFRGGIQPVFIGTGYLDPFVFQGRTYGFSNEGYLHRAPAGTTLENDGWWQPTENHDFGDFLWERIDSPIRRNHENAPGQRAGNPRHFSHRIAGQALHLFFHRRGDMPESILLTRMDLSVGDASEWNCTYPPELVLSPETDWEGIGYPLGPSTSGSATGVRELRDPYILEEDGGIFLFYCGAGEEAIGLAEIFPVESDSAP